ncbi:16S rRNA (uracil(1498)-N(3))-methyltransferase [Corynebacterium sp. 3HC-13]|uniref:16S rRNA (uracil(1498)-N(3))-methyltransferase n=1 Tax=Corynebacterium poyangense TaxID=2684405 RepID=UPI001CCCAD1B|nr:16S rRNA (uracil(1498)-N(3))-methyltransferase [Corynebacterium poyangense]MBZ8178425.1 16S rRNA (uracil(1498)-N(3))-methyltransferase [Corynebacterium poyangense]
MTRATYVIEDLAEQLSQSHSLTLRGAEGRHAVTVKRVQPGEELLVISGQGIWAEVCVERILAKDQALLQVQRQGEVRPPRPQVRVVHAIPKSERAELAVDLSTQAGADVIIPWQAEHCVAKWVGAKKIERSLEKWQQAAKAAAKQARRRIIPTVTEPCDTSDLVQLIRQIQDQGGQAFLLDGEADSRLIDEDFDLDEVIIIIGPEGGISPREQEQLQDAGAKTVRLGPEVLRTASAGMVALAAIGSRSQRW